IVKHTIAPAGPAFLIVAARVRAEQHAARFQSGRFAISERIGFAICVRGRAQSASDRLAQGPAFRRQRGPATKSRRPGDPTMKRDERKIALRCAVYTRVSLAYDSQGEKVSVVDKQLLLYRKFATVKWPWEDLIERSLE